MTAKWDLSKLPEGRKPLPDEWFAERAQMQNRIKELEAKLAKALKTLECYAGYWAYEKTFIRTDDGGELASETIKELTGGKNE